MIGWAYDGDASAPQGQTLVNPPGFPVAVVSTHSDDSGAWPGLLPAVGRSIAAAGHVPLAVRFDEIRSGQLTFPEFHAVVFPGGGAYAYKTGLAGFEDAIRSFVSAGGGYLGICAGSLYAADSILWQGRTYDYPLDLFRGQDTGPIDDIAPWPLYALTPLNGSGDPAIGDLGVQQQLYHGGGWKTVPSDSVQGSHVFVGATLAYGGSAAGLPAAVRFSYGSGCVFLVTTHPEARAGSEEDGLFWDDYDAVSGAPVMSPTNPWVFMKAVFDGCLAVSAGCPFPAAIGPAGLAFQWALGGTVIPGATARVYTTPGLAAGAYAYTLRAACSSIPACESTSPSVDVTANPGSAPGVTANSLRAVKDGGGALLTWASTDTGTWNVHRADSGAGLVSLWLTAPLASVKATTCTDADSSPPPIRYYQVFGADCTGASRP